MKTTKFHLVLGIGLGLLAAAGLSLGITQGLGVHEVPAVAETSYAYVATFDSDEVLPDTRFYTEMDFMHVAPTTVDRYDRGLFDSDEVLPDTGLYTEMDFMHVAPSTVDRYDRGPFDSEFGGVAPVAPAIVDRYDRSLFDGNVAPTTVDRYDRGLFDSAGAGD